LQWQAGKRKYDQQNQELHPVTWWRQNVFHFFIPFFIAGL
jgi:hypothetical protein